MRSNTLIIIILCSMSLMLCPCAAFSQSPVIFRGGNKMSINNRLSILTDKTGSLKINDVLRSDSFKQNNSAIISKYFGSGSTYWIRFRLTNASGQSDLYLTLNSPLINEVKFFKLGDRKPLQAETSGINFPFKERYIDQTDFIFDLSLPPLDTALYLLKIKSIAPLNLTLVISNKTAVLHDHLMASIITSLYIGILLALFLYNLFIYSSIKDKTYFFYVLYILFIGLTQISLFGYTYKFFWPRSPGINQLSIVLFPVISGVSAILFSKYFLETKTYTPALDKGFNIFIGLYGIAFLFSVTGLSNISFRLIDLIAVFVVLYALFVSVIVLLKGNKSSLFYLISFATFIIAMCIFVLKNTGTLPNNSFDNYSLYIGTSIQAILLSFALADKINLYKKEKEISQAKALQASLEKEQFVREQNVILESKVRERTNRLTQSNRDLTRAMNNLKKAESQLVHAEKMASLGQLTAGIAHEINNPINFVKSNIKPLKLDIRDMTELVKKYKQINKENIEEKLKEIEAFDEEIDWETLHEEITALLNGIEEGSTRTADIVRGLRTFSRLDEDELKEADIHAGIDATLTLLGNIMPPQLTVAREYGKVPLIECYAGKLNQVFMNILTNSIQAVTAKALLEDEKITITTKVENKNAVITIADTGVGIPEAIRDKIFDPFFTTKNVGEGTGLGLSMTFSIIQKHHGDIAVHSEEGKGSEFVITIPVNQAGKD